MTSFRFRPRGLRYVCVAVALVVSGVNPIRSQDLIFERGQDVSPAFEGWEKNPDGSFNMVFGYFNRNFEETFYLPPSPANNVEPGGPDQGQPTYLQPRRHMFVFKVRVPADFGGKEVVWTLTTNGKTNRAYATLKPEYAINEGIVSANYGGPTSGKASRIPNKAPELAVQGATARTVKVGEPVSLVAFAKDDGNPNPKLTEPDEAAWGLRVAWYVYRGAGQKVTFDPAQFKTYPDIRAGSPWTPKWQPPPVPPDGRYVVRATFTEPGIYVLRCLAHDGALPSASDITVTVVP